MRDQIRRAFEENTEEPHDALRSGIRTRLEGGRPAVRRFGALLPLAAAASALLIVLAGGYLLLGRWPLPAPAPGGPASPTPAASASPAASPSASPDPLLAPFTCAPVLTPASPGRLANVTDVRVGASAGYDRFVIQFDGPVPEWSVTPQSSSSFVEDGSGRTVVLAGSSGLRVVIHGASAVSSGGRVTYSGPTDLQPKYPVLREARRMGDFERTYTWGLGLARPACFRAFVLTGSRLVVDVQSP